MYICPLSSAPNGTVFQCLSPYLAPKLLILLNWPIFKGKNSRLFGLESNGTVFSGAFISKFLVNLSRFSIVPKFRKFRKFPGARSIWEKKSEFSVQNQMEQQFRIFYRENFGNLSKLTIFPEMSEITGNFRFHLTVGNFGNFGNSNRNFCPNGSRPKLSKLHYLWKAISFLYNLYSFGLEVLSCCVVWSLCSQILSLCNEVWWLRVVFPSWCDKAFFWPAAFTF